MSCSICLESFNNPTITKCGHTFCKSCYPRKFELDEEYCSFKCYICKRNVFKSELSPNLTLTAVLDCLQDNCKECGLAFKLGSRGKHQ